MKKTVAKKKAGGEKTAAKPAPAVAAAPGGDPIPAPPVKGKAAGKKTAAKKAATKKTAAKPTAAPKTATKKTAAKKATARKATSKPATAKPAAGIEDAAVAPSVPGAAPATRTISRAARHAMIAEAAYLRSEAHGFTTDSHADWVHAEAEVDQRLLRDGILVAD